MPFREINSKMVEATVNPGQRMFSQRGAMLAYNGDVTFTPNITGGQGGVMSMIGRRVANEATPLMTVEVPLGPGGPGETPCGTVMFGHGGHHIQVINLSGDTLYVEADRLLAFDGTLEQGTMFMGSQGGVMGMVRGQVTGQGLFTTTLRGHGAVAVMAHGGVIELPITPGRPVHVDPQAYVAHHGDVRNKLSAALGWRDMVGRGSGEAFQLELSGSGAVYVQASEEKL
ncbi:AIM24 family protein [Streptomyces sp. HNM0663]|uniref:AIM24 family protein n=1 Tax=Streptomyces chengmaiensis TaxID=3040919 RepID=A0ABT6HEX9_9ACTN|nr:AIM24 family protein [Streptomyces chengmaiensis]MDH2387315.1 AIM24 family protein [Streptomyces chengmaiensis]